MPKPLFSENVKYLVLHCSGTRCNQAFTVAGLINTGNQRFGQPSYYHKNKIIRRQSRHHSLSD